MQMSAIRHLPVVEKNELLGLVTQRDLLGFHGSEDDKVRDCMRSGLATVTPETMAHEAAYLMLRGSIGSIPVVDTEGRLVGIVTDTDFVRIAYTLLGGKVSVEDIWSEENEAESL